MALPRNSKEETNYVYISKITTNIISEGLRTVFKNEWDTRYQTTYGFAWDDTPKSGQILCNLEDKIPKIHLPKFKSGNTKEWDITTVCYALFSTKCIGEHYNPLDPLTRSAVENLRKIRNDIMHVKEATLSDSDFEAFFKKIRKSFIDLHLPVKELDEIKAERISFCSFRVLPPHPAHDVISRKEALSKITDGLSKLYSSNDGQLTYLYISGNTGSGKSQLSRQIGETHYTDVTKKQSALTFVMTLDAKSLDTLLESYKDFAHRLNCPKENVSEIISFTDTTPKEKILLLRREVSTKIKSYKSWLIIVDNVEELKVVTSLLPQLKDEEWNGGQVLITTQDLIAIPPDSSFTKDIRVSEGMEKEESRSLLASLSGTSDSPILDEVAKQLDYQPLALAAAAIYVKEVTEMSPAFSWSEYLKKLEDGKRKHTEELLSNINTAAYSLTMTTAVRLAVEKSAKNDKVLRDAFHFLSLASHESLPLEIVIEYVLLLNEDQDEHLVGVRIRKCSLILSDDQDSSIRLHRVVHDAFRVYADKAESEVMSRFEAAARSFYLFKKRRDERSVVPHLKTFHAVVTKKSPNKKMCFSENPSSEICEILSYFGCVLDHYGELPLSKLFHVEAVEICKKLPNHDRVLLAELYSHLACIHYHLGELKEAKDYDERTLNIRIEKLGACCAEVATAYNNLATVYRALGDLEQAKKNHEIALKIRIETLDPGHNDIAASYNNLGKVYRELPEADLTKAKECFERALEISTQKFGSRHLHVATANKHLGNVCLDQGHLEQAERHQKVASEILIENFGLRHIRVADAYKNLGNVYLAQGNQEQAKQHSEDALEILIEKLGRCHIRVATAHSNLAEVYKAMGGPYLHQAKEHHRKALEIRTGHLEPTHPLVATSYKNLAKVCEDLGEKEEASKYNYRAIVIPQEAL